MGLFPLNGSEIISPFYAKEANGRSKNQESVSWKNEADSLIIDFWYDSHIDHFIPLVIQTTKK